MAITGLLIGILVGFVLQRGQFCISGQLKSIMDYRSLASIAPIGVAIAIQMVGFYGLSSSGLMTIPTATMPVVATLVGATLFGLGMGIAGCCVTGQLFRAGQGLLSAWVTLLVFSITTVVTQTGLLKYYIGDIVKTKSQLATIPSTLGLSPLWFIVPFVGCMLLCAYRFVKVYAPERGYWSPLAAGAGIGILGTIAWPLSADAGRDFGLSFTIPLGNALQYIMLDQQRYLNWGTYLVIGVLIGSLVGAFIYKQWRKDTLSPRTMWRSVLGGVLMGVGAALTGGCTMANVIVSTAYFSWQGWVATGCMMLGLWIANRRFV